MTATDPDTNMCSIQMNISLSPCQRSVSVNLSLPVCPSIYAHCLSPIYLCLYHSVCLIRPPSARAVARSLPRPPLTRSLAHSLTRCVSEALYIFTQLFVKVKVFRSHSVLALIS